MVTMSGKMVREHPKEVIAFLRATRETQLYIASHMDEVIAIAAEKTGIPAEVIKNGITRSKLFILPLSINMDSVRLIANIDIASGKLPNIKSADLDQFLRKAIDESFLKKSMN